jgi:hypothetical protein
LSPQRIGSLTPGELSWVYATVGDRAATALSVRPLRDGETLLIQEGKWLLSAKSATVWAARTTATNQVSPSWFLSRAILGDGTKIPAGPLGVEIEIDSPLTLKLELDSTVSTMGLT